MDAATIKAVLDLGITGILGLAVYVLWRYLGTKDAMIKEMNDNLRDQYKENTKAILDNSVVMIKLTSKLDESIKEQNGTTLMIAEVTKILMGKK